MEEPLGQVPRSQRLGDGQPGQGGYYEAPGARRGQGRERPSPSRLLTGRDEVRLSAPALVALAIVQESLVEAFRLELDVQRPIPPYPERRELDADPERVAERMLQQVGALFSAAEQAGRRIDDGVLERASRHGANEALHILEQLELSGEECAEAVDTLLAAWARRLARLALEGPGEAAEREAT